jgi:hypothetical protein
MSLNFYYEFRATATTPVEELKSFLSEVGAHALDLGFVNAVTVNCVFRSVDQLDFARRVCLLPWITDERIKSADFSSDPAVFRQDRGAGECSVYPTSGVILVVVNEAGHEATFGFLKFPPSIAGVAEDGSRVLIENPVGSDWKFHQRVQSPDPRYRALVRDFADAGFLASEEDDYGS